MTRGRAPACSAETPSRKARVRSPDRLPYVRTAGSNVPIGPRCKVRDRKPATARRPCLEECDEQLTAPAQKIVRCRIDHTAAGEGGIELRAPQGQLEAWEVSDVAGVIAEAEAAAQRGWYAAGFVAYEAAPAFDGAFRVKAVAAPGETIPHLPLAWFGLFAESEAVVPLRPAATSTEPPRDPSSPESPIWRCEIDQSTHAAGVRGIRGAIADGTGLPGQSHHPLPSAVGRDRRPVLPLPPAGDRPQRRLPRLYRDHRLGGRVRVTRAVLRFLVGTPDGASP